MLAGNVNCRADRYRYWGVFWIDASSRENAQNSYAEIGRYHGKGDSFKACIHWLATRHDRWLLILDNADEPERDVLDIAELIPTGNRGHVLITTRNPHAPAELSNAGYLNLKALRREEAIDLLLRCASNDERTWADAQSRSIADEIATKILYRIARTIDAAGRFIRHKKYTLERYLRLYLPLQRKHESLDPSTDPAEVAVVTTWETPMGHIERKAAKSPANRDAVELFRIFTFLHCDGIPQKVFHDLWRSQNPVPTSDQQLPSILSSGHRNIDTLQLRLEEAVNILYDYGVIESVNFDDSVEGLSRSCYTFHPLVQSSARHRMKAIHREQRPVWLNHTLHALASSLPIEADDLDPKLARKLIPHVRQCLNAREELDQDQIMFEKSNGMLTKSHPTDLQRSIMLNEESALQYERLITVYDAVAWWKHSAVLHKMIVAYWQHNHGARNENTLRAERKLSINYWYEYELEGCIKTQLRLLIKRWFKRKDWLDWFLTPITPIHVDYCIALSDLTQSLWQAHKHPESLRTGQRAVAGLTKRLGKDDMRTLTARFNLGRTLMHLGRTDEAQEALCAVVKARKQYLRPKHMEISTENEETELFKRRPPGLNHSDTLFARSDLALNLRNNPNRKLIVERIMKNVLKTRQEIFGEEHPYTLLSHIDLGSKILGVGGKTKEGIAVMEHVIPIIERILGDHRVYLHMAYGSLARAYAYDFQWQKAEAAIAKIYNTIDPSAPHSTMVSAAYARLQFRAGNYEASEKTLRQLLDNRVYGTTKGVSSPATQNVLEQLAVLYKYTGQTEKLGALKKIIPKVNENSEIGSMYDTFNMQFPEAPDPLKTLFDIFLFPMARWAQRPNCDSGVRFHETLRRET